MSGVFYFSYVVLWGLVVIEGALLLLVFRHFGLTALSSAEGISRDGLPIGETVHKFTSMTASGERIEWAPNIGRSQVMAFVSADCGPCANVLPSLNRLAELSTDLDVTYVVPGSLANAARMMSKFHPPASVTCIAEEASEVYARYRVRVTPYIVVAGIDGRILSKGLCDSPAKLRQYLELSGIDVPNVVELVPLPNGARP